MNGTQVLIKCGISSLPVSVSEVAAHMDIKMTDYAAFRKLFQCSLGELFHKVSYAGFSTVIDGQMVAVLNSQLCYAPRRKWTAAHEVGHLLCGHITDPPALVTDEQEREADSFAAELLAPLTVLHFCGVSSAMEIEKLCGISRQAAELRFQELSRLRRMQDDSYRLGVRQKALPAESVFLKSEEERELFYSFVPFIGSYIMSRSRYDDYEKYLIRRARQPMAI